MLTGQLGTRQGAKKVMIIVSDAMTSKEYIPHLEPAVQQLNATDIYRIGIAVTDYVNQTAMHEIVNGPLPGFYGVLQSIWDPVTTSEDVVNALCSRICYRVTGAARSTTTLRPVSRVDVVATSTTSPSTTTPSRFINCTNLDLAFVVDSSGSINYDNLGNWNLILGFCNEIVDQFVISPSSVRIAFIVFSDNASVVFHLNTYSTSPDVKNAITNVGYLNGQTNLNAALGLLRTDVFADGRGSRPGSSRVALIITDGRDDVPEEGSPETIAAADACKAAGIRLMAVGVTAKIDASRLMRIASSSNDFYNVTEFKLLTSSIITSLSNCRGRG